MARKRINQDDMQSDEEIRDEDGLIVDEYSDDSLDDPSELDALDVPASLIDASALDQIADDIDRIEEVDLESPMGGMMDTIDSGARAAPSDDADMGLGAEPHSPEELERAAIGRALRGRAGVTRDDQVHGERLLDSPDDLE